MAVGISKYADEAQVDFDAPATLSAVNEVRLQFARELHDLVAQPLIGLVLEIDNLKASLDAANPVADELARIEETARGILREARETMIDLRELADLRTDLARAIETQVVAPPGRSLSLRVTSRWPRRTNGWAAFNLLRIVQQSAANAWRHGRAEHIDVVLDVGPSDDAVVVILDDGVGIDDAPRGFGMQGMVERAAILGGAFKVGPSLTGGSRAEVRMPARRLI